MIKNQAYKEQSRSRIKKYRPSLTSEQVIHILYLAESETPLSLASIKLIGVLAPFLDKLSPNASSSTLTNSRNSSSSSASAEQIVLLESLGSSKEQVWEAAYKKACTNSGSCSPLELEQALEHKYLNELMTEEELAEFEAKEAVAQAQQLTLDLGVQEL